MKIKCDTRDLSFKLLMLLVIIFFAFILVVSNNERDSYINSHKENLVILANEKAEQVDVFLSSEETKLSTIASMNDFINVLLYPKDKNKIALAKERIKELKNIIPGISILNSAGKVIVGDIDLPGTDYSKHPYFVEKRTDISFTRYHDPLRKKDFYAIIGPVHDLSRAKIIGRIAFDIEIEKINGLLVNKENDPKHEHIVYFIDKEGVLLSSSKFSSFTPNGLSGQIIVNEVARKCFDDIGKYLKNGKVEEHEEGIARYKNFEGQDVFGTHSMVSRINGCVITEESADNILAFSISDAFAKSLSPFPASF